MYILLVYTVKICQKIDHFIISGTKVENRKPPLKWNHAVKERSGNISVRRTGRHVVGLWLVLLLKSQAEEARIGVIGGRLSLVGSLVLACIVSQSWDRMYCADKWARRQQHPPLSSLWGGGRDAGTTGEPWSPPLRSEPQLHWGQPPWHVCLGSKVAVDGGRETHFWGSHGHVWLLILLPCKEIVLWINAPVSLMPRIHSQALEGPERCHWKVDTPPRAPNLYQEAAEALGKPTSSLHVRCNNAGKLPWVRVDL